MHVCVCGCSSPLMLLPSASLKLLLFRTCPAPYELSFTPVILAVHSPFSLLKLFSSCQFFWKELKYNPWQSLLCRYIWHLCPCLSVKMPSAIHQYHERLTAKAFQRYSRLACPVQTQSARALREEGFKVPVGPWGLLPRAISSLSLPPTFQCYTSWLP